MIRNKPYLISGLAIPFLALVGFLFRQHTFNIQLYDTYFVIANPQFVLVGSVLLLVVGMGYWLISLTGKTLNTILTGIHIFLTVSVLFLFTLPLFTSESLENPDRLFFSIIAFLLGQCAYAVNILITLLWKRANN
jgi:heme/copper-type cytochrome/quinol oxidase subunit 1